MTDLYVALAISLTTSTAMFGLGLMAVRRFNTLLIALILLLDCALVVASTSVLDDSLLLARMLPFRAAIIYGNAVPPAVGFLAGVAWCGLTRKPWRRALLIGPMVLLGFYQAYGRLLGAAPPLDDRWKNGVCRQSSQTSCGAAAAATLLRAYGIAGSEPEMAALCLTRRAGTPMLGLYRGLKLKTAATKWDVRPFHGDIASLRTETGPVLLSVRLDRRATTDQRYEHAWGWSPGVGHAVVFFGFRPDGNVEIGDPSVGREQWRVEDLEVLWHGEGIRLEPRR